MAWSKVFRGSSVLRAAAKSKSSPTSSSSVSSSSSSAAAAAAVEKKEKPAWGIMKPVAVSPAMKNFVGSPEISRAQAIKKIWEHIKLHNLQNPTNKKEIVCDDKLKSIFQGKDIVGMMEISRLVGPHFLKSN